MLKEELVNALNASPNDEINLKYIMNRLDDEVRNRMLLEEKIELAKFLEMKDKKSKNYKKVINGITLFYTDNWEKVESTK